MSKVSVSAVAFHVGADRMTTIVVELSWPLGTPCITCACATFLRQAEPNHLCMQRLLIVNASQTLALWCEMDAISRHAPD